MKLRHFCLFLSALWLVNCRQLSTAIPTCDEPGHVTSGQIDDTKRGYPYYFNIYLPPCYNDEAQEEYPVLYLIPGRGGGPGDWFAVGVSQTAEELILTGQIPPLIIVTTESTDADSHGESIFNDLIPAVESRYRIQKERRHRAVAGGSLGGVAAYRLAFRHPDYFATVGMFGSGLISGEEETVRQWIEAFPPEQKPRVFLNCGEQDPLMLERAQVMITTLQEMNIESTSIFTSGDHTYAYWAGNFPAYLGWLAEEW